jgi:methylthioribulose 1-phosphate dehydratase/enolase-phosphatase E1
MNAQLATLLDPSETATSIKITHLEMLKGVGHHAYDDVLEVPIIDNRPTEDQLADQLEAAVIKYPKCNAVLVRRHGIYAWGDSWEQAKAQCESFDYLFETAVKLKSMGIDCGVKPVMGSYRVDDESMGEEKKKEESATAPAFNAAGAVNNDADLALSGTTIPLLPRDAKTLLLDIEGTTSSISFVKDILFPYVRNNLEEYLSKLSEEQVAKHLNAVKKDYANLSRGHPSVLACKDLMNVIGAEHCNLIARVLALMDNDVKATGLKALQGDMWKSGYETGAFVGHIYADFKPMLDWCKSTGVRVCIYSSGSIAAQKLLFSHTKEGDLTGYFDAHFDTTTGDKKVSTSYTAIAKKLNVEPGKIVFATDSEAEIKAAREAGMVAVMAVRPGNAPLNEDVKKAYPMVRSLLQLCGDEEA